MVTAIHALVQADEAEGVDHSTQLALLCGDVGATSTELADRGAQVTRPVRDDRVGLTTSVQVPGELVFCQPGHPTAFDR